MRSGAARAGGGGLSPRRGRLKVVSNWRSVRLWERQVERDLRREHELRLNGLLAF
ncbi:hypothetical protein APY03_7838 [Variovorax sp. WDL1]|nr:hypothetical protein APY03_7838 [Variovorax sp. WDL1]